MTGAWTLHGIVRGTADPEDCPVQHRCITAGPISALLTCATGQPLSGVGAFPVSEPEAMARAVLDHDALLSFHARRSDIVPVRLGTTIDSFDRCRALLAERAEALLAALDSVAGCAEIGLRIEAAAKRLNIAGPQPDDPPADGRSFLRQRALLRRKAAGRDDGAGPEVERLLGRLGRLARRTRAMRPSAGRLADLRLLVPRAASRTFVDACADESESLADTGLRLVVAGPWAPYSFATGEIGEAVQ